MPFGLVNAPPSFQSLNNHIFQDMLDRGMIFFMDDIIIHTETLEKHNEIVFVVLNRLHTKRLRIALEKCEWAKHQVEFLEYMISR